MLILRVPIYIFDILRHHVLMIYAQFLWRTHCPTENSLKAAVFSEKGFDEPNRKCKPGVLLPPDIS